MLKKLFLPLLAVAALLAACGGDDRSFNSADVEFAQGMIPHHEQAVGMATLALTTADKPEVLDLAKRIQLAQDPEIATMQDWLKDWGKGETTEGMDHGATDMGMMSEQEMTSLQSASGAD